MLFMKYQTRLCNSWEARNHFGHDYINYTRDGLQPIVTVICTYLHGLRNVTYFKVVVFSPSYILMEQHDKLFSWIKAQFLQLRCRSVVEIVKR